MALAATAAVVLLCVPGTASADAPSRTGWWTATSVGAPVGAGAPAPPDVPSGGLVVQSGTDEGTPAALAAVTYDLPPDSSVDKLVLHVAASSGTTPSSSLALCPLRDPDFTQVQGGAMSDAPKYDCAHQVVSAPSDDGTSYTFSVSGLLAGNALAVAILPVSPASRVVLDAPAADSLVVTELTTQDVAEPASASAAAAPASPEQAVLAGPDSAPLRAVDAPAALPPAAPEPAVAAAAAPDQAAAPVAAVAVVPVARRTGTGGFHHGGALALVLCVIVAGAWTAAGASAGRAVTGPAAPS
jgi:hypothetical protein